MHKFKHSHSRALLITGLLFLILSEKAIAALAIVICWVLAGILIGTGGYLWYRARQEKKRRQLLLKLYGNPA
ncbi:hypothetical protein I2I11_04040 [Pontibacter sp. 172403-2]|uniref:hypothetical protein n=1 Tax=Pontibacter rufus TaxID=2791028 RepID=UPI0018AFBC30|nr:hypothetical protein [Pontibacter sp. 172403-2]MBF9252454.1 hypothetical protein [Pontibacter sp. 172403-2]